MFVKNNLCIIVEVNKKVVNFFDVILDLIIEKYKLYLKFVIILFYVYSKFNYFFCIIKNIFEVINKRLFEILLDEEVFKEVVLFY